MESLAACYGPQGVHVFSPRTIVLGSTVMVLSSLACAQQAAVVSEQDFLGELPIVASVSRLPQRLDDVPGAVTVLDRDFIRRSGARDVADLLRLVPGFQSSIAFESSAPLASYHGGFEAYSKRMQVLVDGRSVYSPYFMGGVGPGLQTVGLQDIERIEVLRGSNSAAYGARAVLGVINIITRDTADTQGQALGLRAGGNGVRDAWLRLGWTLPAGQSRVSIERRGDQGLDGANGANRVSRLQWRTDLQPTPADELQWRLGGYVIDANRGQVGNVDDLARPTQFRNGYVQVDWRHTLNADADVTVQWSRSVERNQDHYLYSLLPVGIPDDLLVASDGSAISDTLLLQHGLRLDPALRLVWGTEWRQERVHSTALYNTESDIVTRFARLFANAEWRMHPDWVLNAGVLMEHANPGGTEVAPRVMLNWRAAPNQTWRAGVSAGFRPPSTYERAADRRFVWNGITLLVETLASGKVRPEHLRVAELGYLAQWEAPDLTLDARLFHEQVRDFITQLNNTLPKDYGNTDNFLIRGLEYQLAWRPASQTRLRWTQAYIDLTMREVSDRGLDYGAAVPAPRLASTLIWQQDWGAGWDTALIVQSSSTVKPHGGSRDDAKSFTRTDCRLGRKFKWNGRSAELGLIMQNATGATPDYRLGFEAGRMVMVTLDLES